MHYGNPEPKQVFAANACDGFVVGGGASTLMKTGAVCEMEEKPFWLQLVGTGITAAFSLHFGGVLRQATWPAVNCHQLYVDDLLTQPLLVEQGTAAVPDRPGPGTNSTSTPSSGSRPTSPRADLIRNGCWKQRGPTADGCTSPATAR
jgi:galactonate dehydratase